MKRMLFTISGLLILLTIILIIKFSTSNGKVRSVNTEVSAAEVNAEVNAQVDAEVHAEVNAEVNAQANADFNAEVINAEVNAAKVNKAIKVSKLCADALDQSDALDRRAMQALPLQAMKTVKRFVLFVGIGRSGSSILGSLMDAHPHVVISNEYYILNRFLFKKNDIFNALYARTIRSLTKLCNNSKGYTLEVDGLWQADYSDYIEVFGDKSASHVSRFYLQNKQRFIENYDILRRILDMPILVIHPLRNPFDIITTLAITKFTAYRDIGELEKRSFESKAVIKELKLQNLTVFQNIAIANVFSVFDAAQELTENVFGKENVLEVHNCDLVSYPKRTLSRIFDFLEVDTTEHYLDVCAEKVFKSVSRSRNVIKWTPEQIEMVERRMKKYKFLQRYSYTSE